MKKHSPNESEDLSEQEKGKEKHKIENLEE